VAVPAGAENPLDGAETVVIQGAYPAGLDPLVARAATGREAPGNAVVVGLETVHHVGRIVETGLPVLETMVTVGETGRIVTLGTPVGALVDEQGETLHDGDRIVLGGVLRGRTAASPAQGVDRATTAVSLVRNPAPVAVDAACVGCGECVRRCPARLDPAMITSYAEFGQYDKARAEHVHACFECGLCGYFCIARRPMLQYIRLAKTELARSAAQIGEENQQ
jgi:electron transport complex protein RnfC